MKSKVGEAIKLLIGLILLLLFLLPYPELTSDTRDLKHVYTISEWILSIGIIVGLSLVLAVLFKREVNLAKLGGVHRTIIYLIILGSLLAGEYIGFYCFRYKPHVIDAIVQIWQAKIFSKGQIFGYFQGPISFFVSQHMLFEDGKVYSQYAPGNSLFLLLNFLFYSNLAAVVAALLTLICTYRFTKRIYSESTALLALALMGFSAFFLFNNQSFMNHVPALMFAAICLDLLSSWEKKSSFALSFGVGAACGAIFSCRPLEGIFFALFAAWVGIRRVLRLTSGVLQLAIFGVGACLTGSLYFLYNYLTTGDPLVPGFIKLWGSGHGTRSTC